MPHIVLEKAKSVKECYEAITPIMEKLPNGILKITDKYIKYSGIFKKYNSSSLTMLIVKLNPLLRG